MTWFGPWSLRALRGLVFALSIATLSIVLTVPAGAHTAMLRASPDRNATAGGSITVIDLEFLDPVTSASVAVTYNGVPVAGQTTVADGDLITFTLDQPLAEPGRYQVSYEMISFDSDFTTGGFFFTFDPAAAQAPRIEPSGPGGLSTTTLALSIIGLVTVITLLAFFVQRVDKRRRAQIVEFDGYDLGLDDDWHYQPSNDYGDYDSEY